MAMMKEGGSNKAEDTRSIISGFTEGSSKSKGEGERMRHQQGVSFNRLVPISPQSQDLELEQDESTVEPSSTAWGRVVVDRCNRHK